jgi:hypothetical protein
VEKGGVLEYPSLMKWTQDVWKFRHMPPINIFKKKIEEENLPHINNKHYKIIS